MGAAVLTTNIFLNPYQQPENKLTYSFLALLEHIEKESALELLAHCGVPTTRVDQLEVALLYGGGEGNPDGSVSLLHAHRNTTVFIESKTWRRHLDTDQIGRILRAHVGRSDYLLILTSERDDSVRIREMRQSNLVGSTWHAVLDFCLTAQLTNVKDQFLIRQFADFLEKSDEAWRARMIPADLISDHSHFLKLKDRNEHFRKECWRLMYAIKEEVVADFPDEISSYDIKDHWGRLGIECTLRRRPFGQWVFFGVYHDPFDHKIDLLKPREPEFAIFWDIDPPKVRPRLQAVAGIDEAVTKLRRKGFEFNFPANTGNGWRVCYWRQAMRDLLNKDPLVLVQLFKRQLKVLFDSEFHKLTSERRRRA